MADGQGRQGFELEVGQTAEIVDEQGHLVIRCEFDKCAVLVILVEEVAQQLLDQLVWWRNLLLVKALY